jgi:hypothetical protein
VNECPISIKMSETDIPLIEKTSNSPSDETTISPPPFTIPRVVEVAIG